MSTRNNYEVPALVCWDMAELKFLFGGGGGGVDSKVGNDYIDDNDGSYDNESCLRRFPAKLLLREIHHAIILSIITDTIIPLPLEHH